ncbi:hypothetical protein [uncultured Fusobacterium sp.]|uniref:hypothetical protein n=1 Tax=uncultured Fusobacterium sp. TaxID=159267 RepID=UPI0015A598DD|nr:hypothetical protein [uncultured Fusobacterium sp.]
MIRKYLLDKIKNGENGLKYILLKKDEKNILLSETKEAVKIEELGKEANYYFKDNQKAMELLKKDLKGLKAFKKIAEATSINKLYINSYLYNF